jgi:predicted  nucleic acid-binding Zn-ribbon protein
MTRMGVYDQIKKALQDIVAPELYALRGDVQRLDQKIEAVDHKFDLKFASLNQTIEAVDLKFDQKFEAMNQKFDQKFEVVNQKFEGFNDKFVGLNDKFYDLDVRLSTRLDALRTETVSLKGELLAEIRRLDARMDGMDRELRSAIDIRERLAALEARRSS